MIVHGSNYTNTTPPPSTTLTITFTQPPTITHTAPPTISVQVETTFSYQFTISSSLDNPLNIAESDITSEPATIANGIIITVTDNDVTVSGLVSLNKDLPEILINGTMPVVSVPIMDIICGVVMATTQLVIEQSSPIFSQSHYEFEALEGNAGVRVGPIPITDPNGDRINTPVITGRLDPLFRITFDDPSGIFTNLYLVAPVRLNYEGAVYYDVNIVAMDFVDASLSAETTVRINVIPVNEFTPTFIVSK